MVTSQGGFRLQLLKVGRSSLITLILNHYLRINNTVYVLEFSDCVDDVESLVTLRVWREAAGLDCEIVILFLIAYKRVS